MANQGPNPVLLVATHLPGHVAELEAKLAKAVTKVLEIQHELAMARTLLSVVPAAEPNAKPMSARDILDAEG
jgi:hypothetical protein